MSGLSRQSGDRDISIRRLFNSRRRNLTEAEEAELQVFLDQSPLLAECYWFVQSMYETYDSPITPDQARETILPAWLGLSEEARQAFKEFGTYITSYTSELFAFWSSRLTTGRAESNNRLQRDIQRIGRGLDIEEARRRAIFGASPTKRMLLKRHNLPDPIERLQRCIELDPSTVRRVRHALHKKGKRARPTPPEQYKFDWNAALSSSTANSHQDQKSKMAT